MPYTDDGHYYADGFPPVSVNQTEPDGSRLNQDLNRNTAGEGVDVVAPVGGSGRRPVNRFAASSSPDSVLIPSDSVLIPSDYHKPLSEREEAVRALAEKLCGERLASWQSLFQLARRLKGFADFDPFRDTELVRQFCRAMGIDETEGVVEFVDRWDLVKVPEGADGFDEAVRLAKAKPVPLRGVPVGTPWHLAGSIAFYLHLNALGEPFPFGLERIASGIDVSVMTASRLFKQLVKFGVIHVVNPKWSYKDGECRVVRFTGEVVPGS